MDSKRMWCVLTALAFAGLHAIAMASDDPKTRATLRGLGTICVQMSEPDPELTAELRREGLEQGLLQTRIEQKLQAAGIKVLFEGQSRKSDGCAILGVNLQIMIPEALTKYRYTVEGEKVSKPEADKKYMYRLDVELRQVVSLVRAPEISGLAATWSTGSFGFRRASRIQADVIEQVEAFIQAHSAPSAIQAQ